MHVPSIIAVSLSLLVPGAIQEQDPVSALLVISNGSVNDYTTFATCGVRQRVVMPTPRHTAYFTRVSYDLFCANNSELKLVRADLQFIKFHAGSKIYEIRPRTVLVCITGPGDARMFFYREDWSGLLAQLQAEGKLYTDTQEACVGLMEKPLPGQ